MATRPTARTPWQSGDAYKRASRLSYKERLRVSLVGDPDRATRVFEEYKGTIDEKRIGAIDEYKHLLARYEQNLARAEQAFQYDHLDKQWQEIQELRAELVGPVKAMEKELKQEARRLLSESQLATGPVPKETTPLDRTDRATDWGALHSGRTADRRIVQPPGGHRRRGDAAFVLSRSASLARRAGSPGART